MWVCRWVCGGKWGWAGWCATTCVMAGVGGRVSLREGEGMDGWMDGWWMDVPAAAAVVVVM